ncbi:S8 family peptidase [Paenibacillus sacheonensis]|uniref:S8 family peptidase n=1 Tax=Paenibacillus sacheonensis TaxID=742054 RepID=UPI0030840774
MEKLLLSCSSARPSTHTTRKLIGFKRQDHYEKCVRQLESFGIKPLKSIHRGRVIACHIDSRRGDKLKKLSHHPDIRYVEPDYKVHAHGFLSEGRTRIGSRPGITSGTGSDKSKSRKSSAPYVSRKKLRLRTNKAFIHSDSGNNQPQIPSNIPWNVKHVQAPRIWPTTRGSAAIGIIDTGIGKHPNLYVTGGINTMGGSSYADDNGHGTHVAGIASGLGKNGMIAGVAPRAKLYAVKALDANGAGYVSDLIKGIEWCIKKKIPVINMSLGLAGETSSALKEAVQRARKSGIIVVASAGNDGPFNEQGIDQPARYSDAIAVAASTRGGSIADYSSRGSGIDITAPGSCIKSTRPGGGYTMMSGTSMSSPHVAGGAALLKTLQPSLTPYAVKKRLRATAKKLSSYGTRSQGYGMVQFHTASGLTSNGSRGSGAGGDNEPVQVARAGRKTIKKQKVSLSAHSKRRGKSPFASKK